MSWLEHSRESNRPVPGPVLISGSDSCFLKIESFGAFSWHFEDECIKNPSENGGILYGLHNLILYARKHR